MRSNQYDLARDSWDQQAAVISPILNLVGKNDDGDILKIAAASVAIILAIAQFHDVVQVRAANDVSGVSGTR